MEIAERIRYVPCQNSDDGAAFPLKKKAALP
jgi:hypothetical protein